MQIRTGYIAIYNNKAWWNLFGDAIRAFTRKWHDDTKKYEEATHAALLVVTEDGDPVKRHAAYGWYWSKPSVVEEDFFEEQEPDLIYVLKIHDSLFESDLARERCDHIVELRSLSYLHSPDWNNEGERYDWLAIFKNALAKVRLGWLFKDSSTRVMCSEFISECWARQGLPGLKLEEDRISLFNIDPHVDHCMITPVDIICAPSTEVVWAKEA